MLDEPACGSHQAYLCHASHTTLERGTNEVPVPIRHTRRLCAWGGVADQATRQGALFDNACNAIPNARRGVMWREVQLRDRTRARSDRASVGARGVACLSSADCFRLFSIYGTSGTSKPTEGKVPPASQPPFGS